MLTFLLTGQLIFGALPLCNQGGVVGPTSSDQLVEMKARNGRGENPDLNRSQQQVDLPAEVETTGGVSVERPMPNGKGLKLSRDGQRRPNRNSRAFTKRPPPAPT